MGKIQSAMTSFCLLLACIEQASLVSAADHVAPETYTGFSSVIMAVNMYLKIGSY